MYMSIQMVSPTCEMSDAAWTPLTTNNILWKAYFKSPFSKSLCRKLLNNNTEDTFVGEQLNGQNKQSNSKLCNKDKNH